MVGWRGACGNGIVIGTIDGRPAVSKRLGSVGFQFLALERSSCPFLRSRGGVPRMQKLRSLFLENQVLSKTPSFKPATGQNITALFVYRQEFCTFIFCLSRFIRLHAFLVIFKVARVIDNE